MGMGKGAGLGIETGGGGQRPFSRSECKWYLFSDGFLLSLSMFKWDCHDLLEVRPSSLLILCGCISSSMAPIGSSQLWPKHFPYLYPSTQILGITPTLYVYEDGMASKFRNVGTESSDAGRLPKKHNKATVTLFFDKTHFSEGTVDLCKEKRQYGCEWAK